MRDKWKMGPALVGEVVVVPSVETKELLSGIQVERPQGWQVKGLSPSIPFPLLFS